MGLADNKEARTKWVRRKLKECSGKVNEFYEKEKKEEVNHDMLDVYGLFDVPPRKKIVSYLNLRVRPFDGGAPIFMKVLPNTQMAKLMDCYGEMKGNSPHLCKVSLGGGRLFPNETAVQVSAFLRV